MRLSSTSTVSILATLGVIACSGSGATLPPIGEGGSAESSIGGSTDVGGNSSNGGAASNGGANSNGGTPSTGGLASTGGSPLGAGGLISTGGTVQGAGGLISTGGIRNTGGAPVNVGGSPVLTGGAPPVVGGGTPATGGANPATGGTPSTGNCTDVVPPNQGAATCADWKSWGQCGSSWFTTNNFCAATCNACSGVSTGGAPGAGGAPGNGGVPSTGGVPGAGGNRPTGGMPATGGVPVVTGGRPPTGGMAPTGGNPPTGGTTSNGTSLPPITNGTNAWASRYWDCCKPACGWKGNVSSGNPMSSCDKSNNSLGSNYDAVNACQGGGTAYMCWSGAPWSVSDTVSYGFAAASGTDYVCGRCFQIQFTGTSHNGGANPGAAAIKDKQMIIQVINNGGVAEDQFDLLIPGGGVGALNACSTQWGTSDLGAQYGGFLAGCNGDTACVQQKCQTVFAGKADLMAGCTWFLNWFKAADNPNFVYKQVTCPSALTSKSGMQG